MAIFNGKKSIVFGITGGVAGFLSALLYHATPIPGPLTSWSVGGGYNAALISLFIVIGQSYYQSRTFPILSKLTAVLFQGLMFGALGGAIVYFCIMTNSEFAYYGRIVGWGICGATCGFLVSRNIPNMGAKLAIIAGAIGGVAGCLLMYLHLGFVTGVAVTGAVIGIVVASAEVMFRKGWVDVTVYSEPLKQSGISMAKPINQYVLNLGKDAIQVGYSSDMDILLKAKGIAMSKEVSLITLENGKCYLSDTKTGTKKEIKPGEKVIIENCEIQFCH
ncbi:hypothetical protein EKN56_14890 [Limnobaculum zhutongyuii]|uniref:Uncharacterized protein n=1 Tax=Limnobaculum zhutongyuii TaxID=2498113 RepID=A0A411WMW9_9GAMM|nr:hypothetical protein [Limnobaculum zhutongyuii]QBH97573.1 hypothetical protein EKN56_14890 [Limnobaculum zhutongyuii]TQS91048.1 hypothetical protein ELQ32_01610 [Limnobaculum zhutongyuii]